MRNEKKFKLEAKHILNIGFITVSFIFIYLRPLLTSLTIASGLIYLAYDFITRNLNNINIIPVEKGMDELKKEIEYAQSLLEHRGYTLDK